MLGVPGVVVAGTWRRGGGGGGWNGGGGGRSGVEAEASYRLVYVMNLLNGTSTQVVFLQGLCCNFNC
jgi:hypothetical protein